MTAASFGPLPSAWALPAPANTPPEGLEAALAAVPSGPLGVKQQYSLSLPNMLPSQASGPSVPPVVLQAGSLEYAGNSIWGLTWPVSAPALWLPASAHEGLQASLKADTPVSVKVMWKGFLPPPPDAPPAKGAPKKAGKVSMHEEQERGQAVGYGKRWDGHATISGVKIEEREETFSIYGCAVHRPWCRRIRR